MNIKCIFLTPLTLTAEYVMNGADLMLPGVATLSGMAEKYTFNIHIQFIVSSNSNKNIPIFSGNHEILADAQNYQYW